MQKLEKPGPTYIDEFDNSYLNKFSPSRSGDIGEATVIPEAWKRGAEVYLNAGCDGRTDLILEIEGKLYQINVKVACIKSNNNKLYWSANNTGQVKPPVWAVVVEPRYDGYRIRWPTKRGAFQPPNCPPGLEKFWD